MRRRKTKLNFLIPISLIIIFGGMLLNDIRNGSYNSLPILGLVWGIMELGFYLLIIKTEGKNYYLDERIRYSFMYGESWGFITLILIILGLLFYNSVAAHKFDVSRPSNLMLILVIGFLVRTVATLIFRYQNVPLEDEQEQKI